MIKTIRWAALAGALAIGLTACGGEAPTSSSADDYPDGQIDLTVGFGAGGALDLVARGLTDNVEDPFQISVLNREGAGGTIAASEVVNDDPDGYGAYMASTTIMTAQPHRIEGLAYDDPSTYTPLLRVVSFPQVLAVKADETFTSISDVVAAAQADPGSFTVGTGGEGTIGHLTLESVADEVEFPYTHVPFQGFSESVPALLGGQVRAVMATPADVLPYVESGDMKAVAVFSEERSEALPDTPTVKEEGIDVVQDNYYFVVLPPDVDPDVASALADALHSAMEQPDFVELAEGSGARLDYADSAELTEQLEADYDKFGEIIERLGLGPTE